MAGIAGVVVVSAAMAGWAYDAGRRIAGFDRSESGEALSELRSANAALDDEVARLRSLLTASESSLQIEQSAQKILSERNNLLADENAKLKEDLAVFERLSRLEGKVDDEISLDRLGVRPDTVPGRYRFNFLIALQGMRRGKESQFNLQLVVTPRAGTPGAKVTLPRRDAPDLQQYEIALRNFRRIEGKFDVPADYVIGTVEIRILEAGILKGSKSLVL